MMTLKEKMNNIGKRIVVATCAKCGQKKQIEDLTRFLCRDCKNENEIRCCVCGKEMLLVTPDQYVCIECQNIIASKAKHFCIPINNTSQRLGLFYINEKFMDQMHNEITEAFSRFKILPKEVSYDPERRAYKFVGKSPYFKAVKEGERIPEYELVVIRDGRLMDIKFIKKE